jgi:hypothetical protein
MNNERRRGAIQLANARFPEEEEQEEVTKHCSDDLRTRILVGDPTD